MVSASCCSSHLLDSSTWGLVVEQCPISELQEVKDMLGCDVIDLLTELQSERQALREIADQLADEMDIITAVSKALPEPPDLRERLLKEIRFFIDGLRARKANPLLPGRSDEDIEERGVIQYVMCETDYTRQDSSELSCKLRSVSRNSSSLHSTLSPDLIPSSLSRLSSGLASSTSSHLFDSAHLIREALLDDINEVQQDIASLNNMLEISIEPQVEVPTLLALRKMSRKLEQEYLSPKPPELLPKGKIPSNNSGRRILPPIPSHKKKSTSYNVI
ncbi:hypothetical protein LOD99_341 [Oopsacas minuta]|uniref:Uncharacterized protein n=1 Tax=Oopsacas minuta TaxID=111878 RepID=A0AAV7K8N3_9METZ|nr:hypothetical protein LOD99_341 [Oopsacas minuta]